MLNCINILCIFKIMTKRQLNYAILCLIVRQLYQIYVKYIFEYLNEIIMEDTRYGKNALILRRIAKN